jgi:hypothetical protein
LAPSGTDHNKQAVHRYACRNIRANLPTHADIRRLPTAAVCFRSTQAGVNEIRSKMKVAKVETAKAEFRIWCDRCNIRVAPNEERTVVRGKTYHPGCATKTPLFVAETKSAVTGL